MTFFFCHPEFISGSLDLLTLSDSDEIPDQARNDNKMTFFFCHPEFISGSLDLLTLSDSEKIPDQARNDTFSLSLRSFP